MTNQQTERFIKSKWNKISNTEIAKLLEENGVTISPSTVSRWAYRMGLPKKSAGGRRVFSTVSKAEQLEIDRERLLDKGSLREVEKKYKVALKEIDKLRRDLSVSMALGRAEHDIEYKYKPHSKDTESVAVVLASDWHCEENVDPATVDGFNEYNLNIFHQRAEQFFKTTLRLVEIEGAYTKIDTLVVALLGDFFSNDIHDALLEINEQEPAFAVITAENALIAGIQYLLDHSKLNLIIPCHVGNHSRDTKKVHIATEQGHSWETLMYAHIKNHFRDNPRVRILMSPGYLSYLTFWDYTICFQHGHAVNYAGGVGGLTIPLKKAVAQWQKKRRANLYCLGHWHQFLDIGEAIVNGSMIGYSSYVQFIKGDPERPKQAFFVINKKFHEKISVRPILFTV